MISVSLDESSKVVIIPVGATGEHFVESGVAEKVAKSAREIASDLAKAIHVIHSEIGQEVSRIEMPSELAVKFSFGLNAKGNLVIGEFSGASSFEVSVKWSKKGGA